MEHKIWLANGILILHAIVVGITVAGGVALFTGRFKKFHKTDIFSLSFIACCFGQIISLVLTGGCVFTTWEKAIRLQADPNSSYSNTFLEEYLPFLPQGFIKAIPILTVGAVVGAFVQIYFAYKRKKNLIRNKEDKEILPRVHMIK